MKAIFLLIALYTIAGKDAQPSGDIPEGASCAYEQTGSRSGQLTAGNHLTLTLSGYEAMQLQSVTLQMHSNTSAGAGSLQMKIGDSEVWTISDKTFDNTAWNGSYSTEWVAVSHALSEVVVPKGAPVTLYISATANSLYLQSVQLNYNSASQADRYTVSFNTHIPQKVAALTESKPNAGVVLPDVPLDDAAWLFCGWTTRPVDEGKTAPVMYPAGAIYYPTANCTLHAVYMQQTDVQPWWPADDPVSGDYIIAMYEPTTGLMLYATGAVVNGMLATVNLTLPAENGKVAMPITYHKDAVYTLDFSGDTLRILHKETNTSVMLSANGKLAKNSTSGYIWTVSPSTAEGDAMPRYVISGQAGSTTYYMSFTWADSGSLFFRPTADAGQQHDMLLYAVDDKDIPELVYSSYPFGDALNDTYTDDMPAYRLHIGPHILTIRNGKKYLQINE